MTSITHLALRHRRLVALAWTALTVVGVVTVSSATGGLAHNFNTPGTAGYDANAHINKSLGIDGNEQPTIAVLHLPVGEGMGTAAGQAAAARTFAATNRAGHVAVADYANTHKPTLDLTRRSDDLGTDRRAEPRCRGGAGRGGPDRTRAACCSARRRVRFDHRI